jgi:holo-[acyl-carrier protein] synthase
MRVGVDLVGIDDVARSVEQFGDRYLERVYTPREIADCAGSPQARAAGLAARFAAKEATVKVLRPDADIPAWRSVEVVRAPGGWVDLELTGVAADLARRAGITDLSVALSHDAGLATAVVVGVCDDHRGSEEVDG